MTSTFSADVAAIRERAREKMEQGPVTESYGKKTADVISVLNEVLATELVCWMRSAGTPSPRPASAGPPSPANSPSTPRRSAHAMRVAERISQLGGEPDFNPATRRAQTPWASGR